ncbi:MAG: hypothetical protein R3D45_11470 [Rhizobiaceae bacterium]
MSTTQSSHATASGAMPLRSAWLVFGLVAYAIVLLDAYDGHLYYGDLDDRMRALQVRELLQGHGFFDLTSSFIALPEPYLSHYSRLVDLPYFLIASVAAPMLGQDGALALAFNLWPPVMLAAFLWLAAFITRRIHGDGEIGIGPAVLLAMLMGLAILEFSPGRIDHHNVQLVAMMALAAGLAAGGVRGGLAAGAASTVSIAVGLECVPYIAAGLGALAIVAVFNPERFRTQLVAAGAGFAAAAAPAGFFSLGADGVLARNCDAIGAPWVSAIMVGGAILMLAPLCWHLPAFAIGRRGVALRFASLALPALAAGAALLVAFPECAGDPYSNVQGIARQLWFDRIRQEKPLVEVFAGGSVSVAALCGIYGFIVIVGAVDAWRRLRAGEPAAMVLLAVAAVSLAFFFVLFRSVRFMAAFVPLLLPAAFALRERAFPEAGGGDRTAQGWLIGAALVPVALIATVLALGDGREKPLSVFDQMLADDCERNDISVLGRVEGGTVLASYAMSYRIAEEYPRHRIAAVPLHRAAPAIGRLLAAYTGTDVARRDAALQPYDYLAVCARNLGVGDIDATPLFAALVRGEAIAGLKPVEEAPNTAFRLYRIDHAGLR